MRKLSLCLAFFVSLATIHVQAAEPATEKMAVLPLKSIDVKDKVGEMVTIIATDAVREMKRYEVIAADEINTLLTNDRLKEELGSCDDSSCANDIGKALNTRYLLSGSVGRIGKVIHLSFKFFDVPNNKVLASNSNDFEFDDEDLSVNTRITLAGLFPDILFGDACIKSVKSDEKRPFHELAELFENGTGGMPKNYTKAVELYKCSAKTREPLIMDYDDDDDDDDRREELLERANEFKSDTELGQVYYKLYTLYKEGKGCGADAKLANSYLDKAASSGSTKAVVAIARATQIGDGRTKDPKSALKMLTSMAQFEASGAFYAGEAYAQGLGTKVNMKKACKYYEMAADKGFDEARDAINKNCR